MPTVAISTQSTSPTSPTTSRARGRMSGPIRASSNILTVIPCGILNFCESIGKTRAASAFACAIVTPGFKRANAWKLKPPALQLGAVEPERE